MSPRFALPADDALLTSILMHPEVRRWVAHDGAPPFDPTKYTAHPKSFAVLVDGGAWLAPALEERSYGVHTALSPQLRGARALAAAVSALEFAFVNTDAEQLWTMVPENNPQAMWFALRSGFRAHSHRKGVWLSGGRRWAMTYLSLDVDSWIMASAAMRQVGQAFHAMLESHGQPAEHAEDETHDRYVGFAYTLAHVGQADKAQRIYNRYARACGYEPFEIVSRSPLRIDIHSHLLQLDAEGVCILEREHA